jgi:hypothetical protein
MSSDKAPLAARPDNEYAWFSDGNLPHSRDDRIAEAVALVALLFSLAIGLVIALLPASANAATAAEPAVNVGKPSLILSAYKILPSAKPGDSERLVEATQARAGDQLEYRAVYCNPTAATMHHVMVTVPVPDNGVEIVLDTASPHADLASTDGKHFAQLPLLRVETGLDGRKLSHPAPSTDYRFLRWDLGDVPAGATRTVRTRVQLVATTVASR